MKRIGLVSIVMMIFLLSGSGLFAEPAGTGNMLVVFDDRESSSFNSINLVAIAGWSRDGKVAVYQPGATECPMWCIIDTITDKVLEEDDWMSSWNVDEQERYSRFAQAMQKHQITDQKGALVRLPYAYPADIPPLLIEHDKLEHGSDGANIHAVRGTKRKKITRVDPFGNIPEIVRIYAVKSPFEDRLLVIIQSKGLHIEFDYWITQFDYAGCHVTAGF
ncbi:MAG: hypothetical protein JW904_01990 [Spirochaetales bacterium]|nr:hypothetical protein [Spirochaetales bacterium]